MLSRMEIFSNIESQIERAVQLGEDKVVQALDREIDPLLEDILIYRAADTAELHKQLKFITDILVRRSDDAATVVRLSAKLSEIISHYFKGGQLPSGDPATSAYVQIPLPPVEAPVANDTQAVARVAVISADYRFLYCNAIMAEDLHFLPRQLVGKPLASFCNMAVFDEFYRNNLDMCLAGAFREFRASSLSTETARLQYHVRLTPLRNIERRITGSVMVANVDAARSSELGH